MNAQAVFATTNATAPVARDALVGIDHDVPLFGEFVGAHPERDVVVFAKNTTEAINRLARSLAADDDSIVLTTLLEQTADGEFTADYRADADGSFHPAGYVEPVLFSLDAR
jgi:hypothetical protein